MKIDLHSAIFANESHEYMFAVLYLPFFPTANEGEAIVKKLGYNLSRVSRTS